MRARRALTRVMSAVAVLLASLLVVASPGTQAVAEVAQPDDPVAAADAALKAAQLKLGKTYDRFTAAETTYNKAVKSVKAATAAQKRARTEAAAAAKLEEGTRGRFDQFTEANYRGGNAPTSGTALLTSDSPDDLLARASMLDLLGGEYNTVLDTMSTATARKTKAESDAKQALADAARNRDAAATAKKAAKRAYTAAVKAQKAAKGKIDQLASTRAGLVVSGGGTGDVRLPAVGVLSSGFGPRDGTIHKGQDIANDIGTPILSAMAGTVIDAGPASGFGQWVRVQHDGGLITVYGHVATFTCSVGQQVAAGQQIATMGNEGQSTGPHLHFEVHQDDVAIDPLPWLRSFGVNI
jgi:murein DD-endopeptidase MepM/ murein hydrolase activator NlpD